MYDGFWAKKAGAVRLRLICAATFGAVFVLQKLLLPKIRKGDKGHFIAFRAVKAQMPEAKEAAFRAIKAQMPEAKETVIRLKRVPSNCGHNNHPRIMDRNRFVQQPQDLGRPIRRSLDHSV